MMADHQFNAKAFRYDISTAHCVKFLPLSSIYSYDDFKMVCTGLMFMFCPT